MYIYLSFSHAILFYVSPRLSRTRDPSFSPSFFHNFLLVQRTITVVCALGKEGGSERVDGQTVNVWKIGRRTFDFPTRSASSPPSRLPSHEPLIALFAPIFFLLLLLFSIRGRKKIDYPGMQKKRQAIRGGVIAFRNDVVLSPHRIDKLLPISFILSRQLIGFLALLV